MPSVVPLGTSRHAARPAPQGAGPVMRLNRRLARMRRWLLRRDYVALATQAAISLMILLLVALAYGGRQDGEPSSEERTRLTDVQPQAMSQPERHEPEALASQAPAPKPAEPDPAAISAFEMAGPFLSVDGISLRRGDGIVRLDRVEGPRADDICEDAGGALWACGLHARAALHNLLAGRALLCTPKRVVVAGTIAADCRFKASDGGVSGDLAASLVRLGWARPVPEAAGDLDEEEAAARKEAAGLWRGGWTIRRR